MTRRSTRMFASGVRARINHSQAADSAHATAAARAQRDPWRKISRQEDGRHRQAGQGFTDEQHREKFHGVAAWGRRSAAEDDGIRNLVAFIADAD
jgi:hypothetical protein